MEHERNKFYYNAQLGDWLHDWSAELLKSSDKILHPAFLQLPLPQLFSSLLVLWSPCSLRIWIFKDFGIWKLLYLSDKQEWGRELKSNSNKVRKSRVMKKWLRKGGMKREVVFYFGYALLGVGWRCCSLEVPS